MNERNWIDIEPSESCLSAYEVSKKVIHLRRHSQTVQREEDGAAQFCKQYASKPTIEFWKMKTFLHNQFPQLQHWSDDRWKACLAAGRGAKKRYQYCTDAKSCQIENWRSPI